ncbi:putative addiction module component [Prosthecobacter fusiformis]|uniref:Putative addiction module component n=1 Tax=Prosthecobacter fusiformis TaxID=48464 RepID=A0A4R7RWH4_9BACT|nr:addiction module protein [Prosthecobacter fusiformis]TDU69215.1 putative addiction module component [Prosthecobacter fusiformis]
MKIIDFSCRRDRSAVVERIKKEIRNLEPTDIEALLRDLQNEYVMHSPDDDEISVEAEWGAEIDRRVQEIEEGTVGRISGKDLRRSTEALFCRTWPAKLNIL